ncbi:hypothetical protein LINPERHAP1_LOCUS21374 [Linum perenne]
MSAHDRLLTNVEWSRSNYTQDDFCPRCLGIYEFVIHILRDC